MMKHVLSTTLLLLFGTSIVVSMWKLTAFQQVALSGQQVALSTGVVRRAIAQPGPGNRLARLPSGWDESGINIYREKKEELARIVTSDPNKVFTHEVLPLAPVRTAHAWFQKQKMNGQGPSEWEPETFVRFFNHLAGCRYYVGFGSWIGPTLFYAAQMVDEAFAIEADPAAFAIVETNLALNSHTNWARHVHINSHAVGLGTDAAPNATRVEMASAGAGNSCSGIGASRACGKPKVFWKVNSYPFPSLLAHWGLPSTQELFVKVDIETFECKLIPSWLPWIESLEGPKPVFHIAFHSQVFSCSEEEYKDILKFAKFFDSSSDSKFIEECIDEEKQTWKCRSGETLFYDNF